MFISLCVVGCSNKNEMNELVTKYEDQIEKQQVQIQKLKEDSEQLKTEYADYSVYLQQADRESRRIMRFILEGKFEELKKEYNVDFEIKDGSLVFDLPKSNSPFLINLAGNPMFIASFSKHPNGTDINYYIDDLNDEKRHLINLSFDKNMNFEFIFVGDK